MKLIPMNKEYVPIDLKKHSMFSVEYNYTLKFRGIWFNLVDY
jgi:hypothetical protein